MSERRQHNKAMSRKKATLAAKQEKMQIAKGIKRKRIRNSKHCQGKNTAKTYSWWLPGHMNVSKITSEALQHLPKIDNRSFSHVSPCICKKPQCLKSGTSQSSKSLGPAWSKTMASTEFSVLHRKSRAVISLPCKDKVQSTSQPTKWLHQLLAWNCWLIKKRKLIAYNILRFWLKDRMPMKLLGHTVIWLLMWTSHIQPWHCMLHSNMGADLSHLES